MYPTQPGTVKCLKPAKPVFYNSWFNKPPLGCLPLQCEHGGRYDSQPNTPGWQEDSFWIGGYYGPKEEIDQTKIAAAFVQHFPGMHYTFDLENMKYHNGNTEEDVEDAIRKLRKYVMAVKTVRPDIRVGIYNLGPSQTYWVPNNYYTALSFYNKYRKEGIAGFSDSDRWWLGQVTDNSKDYNKPVWDDTKQLVRDFKAWQASNTRLTYGKRDNGTRVDSWGVIDVVDYMAPSLYDFYQGNDTEHYVHSNLDECRRVCGSRPIYPYVWPSYHPGGNMPQSGVIPIPEWRQHLRWCFKYGADGLIIWGADETIHKEHIVVALDEAERAVSKRY